MSRSVTYDLSKFSGCVDDAGRKITGFTIRATDGEDEAHAAKKAETNDTQMTEELIRFSLVSYTVAGVKDAITIDHVAGFKGFDKWSTKARNFVVAAWRKLSTPDDKELADFFASASD